jgi:hypothetical protein
MMVMRVTLLLASVASGLLVCGATGLVPQALAASIEVAL